jgi:hypothetical protein
VNRGPCGTMDRPDLNRTGPFSNHDFHLRKTKLGEIYMGHSHRIFNSNRNIKCCDVMLAPTENIKHCMLNLAELVIFKYPARMECVLTWSSYFTSIFYVFYYMSFQYYNLSILKSKISSYFNIKYNNKQSKK